MIGPSAELIRFALALALVSPAVVVLPWTILLVLAGYLFLGCVTLVDLIRLRRLEPLTIDRRIPARAFVGRSLSIEIRLNNPGKLDARVDIFEDVPGALCDGEIVLPGIPVPAGGTCTRSYSILPKTRGNHPLGEMVVLRRSPFGLLERREVSRADVVRAFPDTARLARSRPRSIAGSGAAPGGRPIRRRGRGSDFDSLRDYVPGDDPRRVSWAASARRGHPVIRLDRHERNHAVWIAIDTSRSMGTGAGDRTSLDAGIEAALVLAAGALANQDRVAMLAFDSSVRGRVGPHRMRADLGAFVEFLQPLESRPVEPNYRALVRALLRGAGQRSLVVIVSDLADVGNPSLGASVEILSRYHRVVIASLRDPAFAALDIAPPRVEEATALYRRIVLADVHEEREASLRRLRRVGVDVVDQPAERISRCLLERYLEARFGPDR